MMVCPFAFDIQVTGVNTTPAAAGQQSQVRVTLANQGAQTLYTNSYSLQLSLQENLNGLVRNTCSTSPGNPTTQSPPSLPDVKAGETKEVTLNFRFPQAGQLNLVATASISGAEDGPANNNSRTQAVNVPLPLPLICAVTPLTTTPGEVITIRGNWFKRLGSNDTPTVQFGGVTAEVISVVSPLEMTARMPNLLCSASGRVGVAVANATGSTAFANGPTFPGGPNIAAVNPLPTRVCPGGVLNLRITGRRANCPAPTVRLGTENLATSTTGNDTIVVQLPPKFRTGRKTLVVQTPYGADETDISFASPSISGVSRSRNAIGTSETMTINLANFRSTCRFEVIFAADPTKPPPRALTPSIVSTTETSIVVRYAVPQGVNFYMLKVETDYGTATQGISVSSSGPELPSPRLP
jgi:hypothetical protein